MNISSPSRHGGRYLLRYKRSSRRGSHKHEYCDITSLLSAQPNNNFQIQAKKMGGGGDGVIGSFSWVKGQTNWLAAYSKFQRFYIVLFPMHVHNTVVLFISLPCYLLPLSSLSPVMRSWDSFHKNIPDKVIKNSCLLPALHSNRQFFSWWTGGDLADKWLVACAAVLVDGGWRQWWVK